MKLTYYGHSSFLIETKEGVRVLTDPYPQDVFGHPLCACDIVTICHEHFDHNDLTNVLGKPAVLRGSACESFGSLHIYSVPCWHDDKKGALRGSNTIYVFEADGLRLAHLGDLGHMLSDEQLTALGKLDAVLLPVGGTFTLDPAAALRQFTALNAGSAIPMHYAMKGHKFSICGLDELQAAALEQGLPLYRTDEAEAELPLRLGVTVLTPKH